MRRSNSMSSLLACLILIFAASLAYGAAGITIISKDQLREELTKPDVIVIDVRSPHDWDSSHWKIQGAQRELPDQAKEWMGKYLKGKTIVLYCA